MERQVGLTLTYADRAYASALRDAVVGDSSVKVANRKKEFRQLWELTCRVLNKDLPLHDDQVLNTLWDACAKSTWRAQTAQTAVAVAPPVVAVPIVTVPVVAPASVAHSDD